MGLLLAVDIGNTSTRAGVFDGDGLVTSFRYATEPSLSADSIGLTLLGMLGLWGLGKDDLGAVAVCTVVPATASRYAEMCERHLDVPIRAVSAESSGVIVKYDPPWSVGADRIADAVAAVERVGAPVIVVDFGTATTINAVDAEGAYVGGAIGPGVEAALAALYMRAAKLPMVDLRLPPQALGTNTPDAIRSGMVYGLAGLVDGLVGRIRAEIGAEAPVLATGGVAPLVASACETVSEVVDDLTLHGIRILWERSGGVRGT